MKKLLTVAAIVAALVLAACGDEDDGSDSATAAGPTTGAETVAVEDLGEAGSVLVDSGGRALYTTDQEEDGKVRCVDGCESAWTPLTIDRAEPEGSVPGELGVVKRPDGSDQVTYDDQPLYTFAEEGPGEVTGDGFVDAFDGREFTWNVVAVDGGDGSVAPPSDDSDSLGY